MNSGIAHESSGFCLCVIDLTGCQ